MWPGACWQTGVVRGDWTKTVLVSVHYLLPQAMLNILSRHLMCTLPCFRRRNLLFVTHTHSFVHAPTSAIVPQTSLNISLSMVALCMERPGAWSAAALRDLANAMPFSCAR